MKDAYKLGSGSAALTRILDYVLQSSAHEQRIIFTVIRCRTCGIKFPKKNVSFKMQSAVRDFLQQMVSQFRVADLGKAVRIVLDYCQTAHPRRFATETEKADAIRALEQRIFGTPPQAAKPDNSAAATTSAVAACNASDNPSNAMPMETRPVAGGDSQNRDDDRKLSASLQSLVLSDNSLPLHNQQASAS